MDLCFIDTECTGLDPDRHEIWELALIRGDVEHVWHLPVDLSRADPIALNIGRFHERYNEDASRGWMIDAAVGQRLAPREWAHTVVEVTRGCAMVGIVPSFDTERLWKLLRSLGECPMWHYQPVDAEAIAAGVLGWAPPWDTAIILDQFNVEISESERHTALDIARLARRLYEAAQAESEQRRQAVLRVDPPFDCGAFVRGHPEKEYMSCERTDPHGLDDIHSARPGQFTWFWRGTNLDFLDSDVTFDESEL